MAGGRFGYRIFALPTVGKRHCRFGETRCDWVVNDLTATVACRVFVPGLAVMHEYRQDYAILVYANIFRINTTKLFGSVGMRQAAGSVPLTAGRALIGLTVMTMWQGARLRRDLTGRRRELGRRRWSILQ